MSKERKSLGEVAEEMGGTQASEAPEAVETHDDDSKPAAPIGGVAQRAKIKVLHKTSVIARAAHKHQEMLEDSPENRQAILDGGKAKGYAVKFQDYPKHNEVVAWLG